MTRGGHLHSPPPNCPLSRYDAVSLVRGASQCCLSKLCKRCKTGNWPRQNPSVEKYFHMRQKILMPCTCWPSSVLKRVNMKRVKNYFERRYLWIRTFHPAFIIMDPCLLNKRNISPL